MESKKHFDIFAPSNSNKISKCITPMSSIKFSQTEEGGKQMLKKFSFHIPIEKAVEYNNRRFNHVENATDAKKPSKTIVLAAK